MTSSARHSTTTGQHPRATACACLLLAALCSAAAGCAGWRQLNVPTPPFTSQGAAGTERPADFVRVGDHIRVRLAGGCVREGRLASLTQDSLTLAPYKRGADRFPDEIGSEECSGQPAQPMYRFALRELAAVEAFEAKAGRTVILYGAIVLGAYLMLRALPGG